MKKKNVDIILPVYNSENYIIDTIKSIINQTYKDWRLIIIDDNSTDSTERVIINFINSNQYKNKILFFKNKINKGQAFSRNKALKLVKSEFVGFIDSDDTWAKNKLRTQIKFMLKNNYYFTYSNYKSLKNKLIKNISVPNFFDYKNYVRNTSIATSTMIVKKKILSKVFFPSLRLCEDYYFKCRLLKKVNAYKCPQIYSYYRLTNSSLQSNRLKVLFAVWNINKNLNKMNIINNLLSIFFISYNSLKKYGFR